MLKADFLTLEEGLDLIVSFAIAPDAHKSLTLLRTPKFEVLLPEEDRGVTVGFGASSAEREMLEELGWGASSVRIESSLATYSVDVTTIDPKELKAAKKLLIRMIKGTKAKLLDE